MRIAVDSDLEAFERAWQDFFAATRRARGRAAQDGDDLSLSRQHLLTALADGPGLPVGELALSAGVSAPTATRMLDGLERDGIVVREPSSDDRRKVNVNLTDEGRRLLLRTQRRRAARRKAIYDSLSAAEREQAVHLLQRFADLMAQL
jgi:DNA-binding MarR family transcriptional regulator